LISIETGTASTATVFAHDEFALFKIGFGDSANTGGFVVGLFRVYALETAEFLVARFFPLGD
jgi:hypothetical protein